MTLILQISDLHLLSGEPEQEKILGSLLAALKTEHGERGQAFGLIVISGDVFDCATLEPSKAITEFSALLSEIEHVLGLLPPVVVVPGNHDRRRFGLLGPHRRNLFAVLHEHFALTRPNVVIHGAHDGHLAQVVTPSGLNEWDIIAFDSSYLPRGYVSAGGNIRTEDLLEVCATAGLAQSSKPLLLIMHHHLVPTPMTDTGFIESFRLPRLAQRGVHQLLPALVANADREELTMTAFGAGSALALLQSLNRPVLVLHGHKHIAHAKLIKGLKSHHGDVVIIGAGSSASAQKSSGESVDSHGAKLWPSFNVIETTPQILSAECVAFGWKGRSTGQRMHRSLILAERVNKRWLGVPIDEEIRYGGPSLELNRADYSLLPNGKFYDADVLREVLGPSTRAPSRLLEVFEHLPHQAKIFEEGERLNGNEVEVPLGLPKNWRIQNACTRLTRRNPASPFAVVSLMNRYFARQAELSVRCSTEVPMSWHQAFASAVDLGSGEERPLRVLRGVNCLRVVIENASPRLLIRLWWRVPQSKYELVQHLEPSPIVMKTMLDAVPQQSGEFRIVG